MPDHFTLDAPLATPAHRERFGYFVTPVRVEFLPGAGARRVRTVDAIAWRDPDGRIAVVPAGFASDGASIPRPLWSIVGGPLNGPYARAAILHDYQCIAREESSAAVHRRFYRAMRADGASWLLAWTFYAAVRLAGPSWPAPFSSPSPASDA